MDWQGVKKGVYLIPGLKAFVKFSTGKRREKKKNRKKKADSDDEEEEEEVSTAT